MLGLTNRVFVQSPISEFVGRQPSLTISKVSLQIAGPQAGWTGLAGFQSDSSARFGFIIPFDIKAKTLKQKTTSLPTQANHLWSQACTSAGVLARSNDELRVASEGGRGSLVAFPNSFPPASEREARMDDPTRRCENDTDSGSALLRGSCSQARPHFFSSHTAFRVDAIPPISSTEKARPRVRKEAD
jgi:hypothetical protein